MCFGFTDPPRGTPTIEKQGNDLICEIDAVIATVQSRATYNWKLNDLFLRHSADRIRIIDIPEGESAFSDGDYKCQVSYPFGDTNWSYVYKKRGKYNL